MNLVLASFLGISINLLLVLFVVIAILLLGVVLMQRPKQEGLGAAFGAAITDQAFGARTTDVLKKATVWFGTLFMLIAFILGALMNKQAQEQREDALMVGTEVPVLTPEQKQEQENLKIAEQFSVPTEKTEKTEAPAETPAPAEVPAETPAN